MVRETSRRGDGNEILCSLRGHSGDEEEAVLGVRELQPNSRRIQEAFLCYLLQMPICVPNWNVRDSVPPESGVLLDASVCSFGVYPPSKLCMAPRARLGIMVTLQPQLPVGWSLASLNHAEVTSLLFSAPAGWVEHTHGAKPSLCLCL